MGTGMLYVTGSIFLITIGLFKFLYFHFSVFWACMCPWIYLFLSGCGFIGVLTVRFYDPHYPHDISCNPSSLISDFLYLPFCSLTHSAWQIVNSFCLIKKWCIGLVDFFFPSVQSALHLFLLWSYCHLFLWFGIWFDILSLFCWRIKSCSLFVNFFFL